MKFNLIHYLKYYLFILFISIFYNFLQYIIFIQDHMLLKNLLFSIVFISNITFQNNFFGIMTKKINHCQYTQIRKFSMSNIKVYVTNACNILYKYSHNL